ncbi:MAG: hypothetical protein MAG551_01481 [Candidatus Scalindua arabica]|uniref:Uncharacterized protein n=1 Tax=Candidatus Scalindua arabica TaxID=1127984 RepID=A0A942A540_9BACT|nr:hypothetical protein [Candidatus Scalindua arabica]
MNGVNQSVFSNPVLGTYIAVKSEPFTDTAKIAFDTFKNIGITLLGFRNESLAEGVTEILVGNKE